MRWVLLLVLLGLPALEIALFVVVGSRIGVLPTLLLVAGGVLFGGNLIRRTLRSAGEGLRRNGGMARPQDLAHTALLIVAGLLFAVPGFGSDLLALALMVPGLRRLLLSFAWGMVVARAMAARMPGGGIIIEGSWDEMQPGPDGEAAPRRLR